MNSIRNDVNGTGSPCEGPSSGRSLVAQQHEPGRNPTTARKTWSKNDNKLAMMSVTLWNILAARRAIRTTSAILLFIFASAQH